VRGGDLKRGGEWETGRRGEFNSQKWLPELAVPEPVEGFFLICNAIMPVPELVEGVEGRTETKRGGEGAKGRP